MPNNTRSLLRIMDSRLETLLVSVPLELSIPLVIIEGENQLTLEADIQIHKSLIQPALESSPERYWASTLWAG